VDRGPSQLAQAWFAEGQVPRCHNWYRIVRVHDDEEEKRNSLNRNLDVESKAEKERLNTQELADFYIIQFGGFLVKKMYTDFTIIS
jgi:hypothetical protein